MRTIFIGDIHGCLEEFEELLGKVSLSSGDDLILLGDLMDRGPDPLGVIRLARKVGARSVLGNHDEKHLRWARHEKKREVNPKYKNPMKPFEGTTLSQTLQLLQDPESMDWLAGLPPLIRLGDWFAVHAGFEPFLPLDSQREEKLLRVRYVDEKGKMVPIDNDLDQPPGTRRWAEVWEEPVHVVYGHHAQDDRKPRTDFHTDSEKRRWMRYGVDTACCFGGSLTAMVVQDLNRPEKVEFVSVPARRTYAKVWKGKR